ncbi:MAG TPA: antitoxin Xre/MbcA/ParS toxin-binding domain-containing protein [Trueperaceae bacterium]|nr:antitoxin Xre/MbcA/ParS toxin-binding domain-containing protein [Trueperaceae bacterium]
MAQVHQPNAASRLQERLLRHLAPAREVRESAHLAPDVVRRLTKVFGNDEARIHSFLDTPDAALAGNTPADIARVHGFDALDHLVDQVEYATSA